MSTSVLFEERATSGGQLIGLATLNSEKTLNSLTLEMVELLLGRLNQWQRDERVVSVLIRAAGEKAFCAGGDVQALYHSARENPGGPCDHAERFFEQEYRLDYLLHNYSKPVIAWGHGIVMGGGLGVFAGCSHRVVTERTRIAMPEVTIALFPDVGGSYFLNRMPGRVGRFLALTGASINAADCLYTGIADYFVSADSQQKLLDQLADIAWTDSAEKNHQLMAECLDGLHQACSGQLPEGRVEKHFEQINSLCSGSDIYEISRAISDLETEDSWLVKARQAMLSGSPLAVLWIYRQLELCREMPLKQVFQQELQLATNIIRHPEFTEGVRALLIDKDRQPKWQFPSIDEVPTDVLDNFFQSPWSENPLADL
ncbi:MAG: enoyl-CoA hydratase/isomerase family protein [Endozoicomonas sp.]